MKVKFINKTRALILLLVLAILACVFITCKPNEKKEAMALANTYKLYYPEEHVSLITGTPKVEYYNGSSWRITGLKMFDYIILSSGKNNKWDITIRKNYYSYEHYAKEYQDDNVKYGLLTLYDKTNGSEIIAQSNFTAGSKNEPSSLRSETISFNTFNYNQTNTFYLEVLFQKLGEQFKITNTFTVTINDKDAPTGLFGGAQLMPNTTNEFYSTKNQTPLFNWTEANSTDWTANEADIYATLNENNYTKGTAITEEGKHTLILWDYAGNKTTYYLTIDKTPPTAKIIDNLNAELGEYTKNSFKMTYSDSGGSGLKYAKLKRPGSSTFEDYASGTVINSSSGDGTYKFEVSDYAENITTKEIVLDTVKPTVALQNSSNAAIADYTNNSFKFVASDVTSGINYLQIKRPGSSSWTSYNSGTLIASSGDGTYAFRAYDKAGNYSEVSIILDTVNPTVALQNSSNAAITDFTNNSFKFVASDSTSGISSLQIKRPGSSSWTSYTNGTTIPITSGDGNYSFRAYDKAGNVSETSIVLDTVKPTVALQNSSNVAVADYTNNSFKFVASDATSGINYLQIKHPGSSSWTSYTNGTTISITSGDGTYAFRAHDKAGNYTEASIILDTVKPTVALQNSSNAVITGYTNNSFKFVASDSTSGIDYLQIKRPGSSSWTSYTNGTTISITSGDGTYAFRAYDKAGNYAEASIILDTINPTVALQNASSAIVADYTNNSFKFVASDSTSGIDYLQIKKPGSSSWTGYTNGTTITKASGDGNYSFRAYDKAGNYAEASIILDTINPTAVLTPDISLHRGNIIYSASDSNFYMIFYSLNNLENFSSNASKSFTVLPNAANNGTWYFYAEDKAGNSSEIKSITLDTIAPTHNELLEYTNKNIVFEPSDINGISKLYYKFGDETSYTKSLDSKITLNSDKINNGSWYFYAEDNAGNISEIQKVIFSLVDTFENKEVIYNSYKTTSWYTVTLPARIFNTTSKNDSGTYSFADLATALKFAKKKETEYRVSSIPEGFVYVSASNESVAQIYSDEAVLNEAIEKYAKGYVSLEQRYANGKNNYYTPINSELQKETAALTRQTLQHPSYLKAYENLPLYLCSSDYKFTKLSLDYNIAMTVDFTYLANDVQIVNGSSFTISYSTSVSAVLEQNDCAKQGYYLVTESDIAGNLEKYIIYIDLQAPSLSAIATLGDNSQKSIKFNQDYINEYAGTFYYCTLSLTSFSDNIDDFYCLTISGKNLNAIYIQGEQLLSIEGGETYYGKYTIELYDRSLNVLSFDIIIAGQPPKLSHSSLSADTTECRFTISIPDNSNAVVALQLFKVTYNGMYEKLLVDDQGSAVSFTRLNYVVRSGGKYVFVITDLFGRNIETAPLFYLKGLPFAALSGVANNGVTNKDVSLNYKSTDSLILYKKTGNSLELFSNYTTSNLNSSYTATIRATEETSFSFVFFLYQSDDMNLFVEYYFEIDCVISEVTIKDSKGNLLALDESTSLPFSLDWVEPDTTIRYYTSNTIGGANGAKKYSARTMLSEEGTYFFTHKDYVGNTLKFTILLDSKVSYKITGEHTKLNDGTIIAANELTFTILETCLEFNVENSDGNTIINGGTLIMDGAYNISATDSYGNSLKVKIIIDTKPPIITLKGVEASNASNNVSVSFEADAKAYLVDSRDKILRKIEFDEKFTEHGEYRIMAIDEAGNQTIVFFSIDKKVDYSVNIINGAITSNAVSFVFSEELRKRGIYLNDKLIDYANQFTAAGTYKLVAEDTLGNQLLYEFTIMSGRSKSFEFFVPKDWQVQSVFLDKADLSISGSIKSFKLEKDGNYILNFFKVPSGETFSFSLTVDNSLPTVAITQDKNAITIETPSKANVNLSLEKDGKMINYALGDKISETGKYRLTVADDIGNVSFYEFEIKYSLNTASIILVVIAIVIAAALLALIIRSKRKPKIK